MSSMTQLRDEPGKPIPQWLKYFAAACAGAGVQTGAEQIATDSPVHFAVEGEKPSDAPEWNCAPEGGIVGAPMVCRPGVAPASAPVSVTAPVPDQLDLPATSAETDTE